MPELPEVETVANALRPQIVGRRIVGIGVAALRLRTVINIDGAVQRVITAVRRRGKYIIVDLDDQRCLLFHLGMTGSFRLDPPGSRPRKHDHITMQLEDKRLWRFNDPRRFGRAELHALPEPGGLPVFLDNLGPEPLGDAFSARYFRNICKGRSRPIKNLIMDSTFLVGVGNIYASEALFRAGIHPTTAAGRISSKRLCKLICGIREVLTEAIEAGGTTISDFVTVDGTEGLFNRELRVYGHAGEICRACRRGRIRRLVMSGRTTYYCPVCQR